MNSKLLKDKALLNLIECFQVGHGCLVVRSRLWGRRVPNSEPDSTNDKPYIGLVARRGSNVIPLVPCGSLERGVPAQVSSSASDHGSKLRGPS
ncbi:hypothetical protein AVEN_119420-1 [Araneus ventricosus]|uniref:Uncharacterized protein n=1 Tax=Araneus ventricosus TaxID=182803 RepID=A0A4Y2TBU0_ARAVE|nr:hypothetical protein AVEN_229148-1 [Araneus ventricosus]GBN98119.1 hypothetical protein AVEN_119420-1 [Araneus ventricosus]